jgi:hypothetical protein
MEKYHYATVSKALEEKRKVTYDFNLHEDDIKIPTTQIVHLPI